MAPILRRVLRTIIPPFMFLACVLAQGGCQCIFDGPPLEPPQGVVACRTQGAHGPATPRPAPEVETVAAGTIPGTFSISITGEAVYTMDLTTVPSRAGMGPRLQLVYRSDGGDGVLGAGFSIAGLSAITRCPSTLAQDGEIRGVRYDGEDKLCLDGQRLVPVGEAPGIIEYRTFPDTFVKVVGHYPPEGAAPAEALFFEAHLPDGRVVEYGHTEGSKPLARGGAPRAWLANKARDGRGNAMTYAYCVAEAEDGHAAEYAVDEIRYTSFEGTPSLAPSRAVRFLYGTKDPAAIRTGYSGGMALQRALRLEEIQMLGPGDTLVRRYGFGYELSPATRRTLLTQIEECASDGVCKPATRFQYSRATPGFKRLTTDIDEPVSERASPMVFDLDGDGRDDLVIPDIVAGFSTPSNPITAWWAARNLGPRASPSFLAPAELAFLEEWPTVADASGPSDPALLQPELGTVLDYDDDGRADVLLHDVYGSEVTWHVLLSRPDWTFALQDTGIRRPFPLRVTPAPPSLSSPGASMHLADLDGDGVPDLIQCEDHARDAQAPLPLFAVWTVHLWRPARGATPAGFDPTGESIELLSGYPCDTELHTLDLDADSKIDLVVPSLRRFGDGSVLAGASYDAIMRRNDERWEVFDTALPVVGPGGRVVFLDVNGDGLPDAIESGFNHHQLTTYFNTGPTFVTSPFRTVDAFSFGDLLGFSDQDAFFRLAVPLDFNGDGRQDLLMPVPPGMLLGGSDALPSWAVLLATGDREGPPFALADPRVPFEASLGDAITLADPRGPRTGDVNGDGAQDVILTLGGLFTIFQSLSADQDLLVAISDGMNAREPSEPGFVPNVSISYGHLTDASVAADDSAEDPARESPLYVARSGAADDCRHPRRCVVGPRRVVSAYALNNGADRQRRFEVSYRDGRYHRLGRGFLGFGERIVTDLDTGAATLHAYDHVTYDDELQVFPFAGRVLRTWHWAPGLPSQPRPEQVELAFVDVKRTLVPTNDGATYFTLPTERRVRRAQGVSPPPRGEPPSIETYVRQVEGGGGGAILLRDSVSKVTEFDELGNVRAEEVSTSGVDLTFNVTRTFKNDTERWVLGQLETQEECSAAAGISQCRTLTRTTTIYGEVDTESTESDDGLPDTKLKLTYTRDDFGNITGVTAEDAFDHRRTSSTDLDDEGIFPEKYVNAAGHTTIVEYDDALGVLLKRIDPNQLVTEWQVDGFGRLGVETRPDGTTTTVALSRTKDGGPNQDAWRVTERSTTTGGADDTIEFDSLGRQIRRWWYGPEPEAAQGSGETKRIMQEIGFDALGEHIAQRSVPVSEDTPERERLYERYEHDAVGREVRVTTPWNAVTTTEYDGLLVRVTDALDHVTVTAQDPLGRAESITDAADGITRYSYGPFGMLHTVTDPGGAVTRMTRDAFGRIRQLDDPDRGTTRSIHDGFGELMSSTDALGRETTWGHDALGRPDTRVDRHGAELRTTKWTWDTAAHGIGKLHTLTSPDADKTYGYTRFGQIETITLRIDGEGAPLEARLDYDDLGRIDTVTYPAPSGAASFVVAHDHDAHGHVLAVRDSQTKDAYWRLTEVDDAGRFREEVFGNGAVTTRSYHADKQRLGHVVTQSGAAEVQDLDYGYDDLLNLTRRTDALQPENTTERFRYDPLQRLNCAYFGEVERASAPCALRYDYHPNGNLTFKSDVGTLSYDDPLHPHAVTGAALVTGSFGYDAVGNQIARPGGTAVRYMPFDLPERITQGASTVTFAYDGDQQRIRKTTPEKETLYLGDLYERVTDAASGIVEHRYHVHSPERVVAIVTRGGSDDGTRYVHVDHLGSVDALTDEDGGVIERRSYDPFGQRRNPVWGEPAPASFASKTTQGFTGHESDDELGLVNMKGRLYDPRVGRFLTTDPIVSLPSFGQSWNPYSYVLNNPLAYVDPGGFQEALPEDGARSPLPAGAEFTSDELGLPPIEIELVLPSSEHEARADADTNTMAAEAGGAVAPIDVSVVGTSSGFVPEPVLSSAEATSPASLVGGTLLGAAAGTGELALGLAQSLVLNAMTLGGYGAYQHGRAMWDGYQAAGVLGAINAVNPLYEIGRNGADTALAIDRGDYRAAGSAGVKAILLGAATVYGAGRGLGALAEESAAAAGAIRGGASASSFVYQLVDDLGQPVYYGISKHPVSRLGQHARKPEGPFRGMQVISEPLPLPQARALETSLIQQAHAEGRLIYNTAGSSISSTAPIATPTMVQATETMLSPRLYPR